MESIRFLFRGGFMMYPLLLSAFIALTAIVERMYLFHRYYIMPLGFIDKVLELVRQGERQQAQNECKAHPAPISAVLATGIEHMDNPLAEMELAMKNEGEMWVPQMEKHIHVIDTVITAAPLMGLLGTITGMMSSFRALSSSGVNDPGAITGGVSEALIATATGLVIALLCLGAYNYLSHMIKNFIYGMESAVSRLVEARLGVERSREKHANTAKAR